jgi:hypothetical protein
MIGRSSEKTEAEAQGAEPARELKLSRISKGHGIWQHTGSASKEGRDRRMSVFSTQQSHLIGPAVVNPPLYTALPRQCFGTN